MGLSTVVDFEKERRQVSDSALRAIQNALNLARVEFIDENGEGPEAAKAATENKLDDARTPACFAVGT